MITHLLITIAAWLVILYLGINLLGFFVKGLFTDPEINKLGSEGSEFVKSEVSKIHRANLLGTIFALALLVGYLFLLIYIWNTGVLIAALLLMLGRLPDLIWEIKNGKKLDTKAIPKNIVFYISSLLDWISFPLLGYFLYIS